MIRILVADDHAVVRRGLKHIVEEHADLVLAGEAADAANVLEHVRSTAFDVLVLDINMPGRSGLDTLREIRDIRPGLPVLVLSMHAEDQFAARVLKAGAAGYLPKESVPEELVHAIRSVHAGGKYLSSAQAERLARLPAGTANTDSHETLSSREFEVLRRIASGRTVSQIAAELSLSVKTVSTYRARILEKMRLHTSAELTHYAIRNRLVE